MSIVKKIEIGSLNFGKKKTYIFELAPTDLGRFADAASSHTVDYFSLSLLFSELAACVAIDNQPWEFKDNLTYEKRFVINVTNGNINSSFEL